jgi:hypothetical protein
MLTVVAVNSGFCPKCNNRFLLDPNDLVPQHFSAEQIRMGIMGMKAACPGTGQPAEYVKVWEPSGQYRKRVSK